MEPKNDISRRLLDVFFATRENRTVRKTPEEHHLEEATAIYCEAISIAKEYGIKAPTMGFIFCASQNALGSVWYAVKWTDAISDFFSDQLMPNA